MIKNIIFDIGNVMVTYRPDEFISKLGADIKKASELAMKIFKSSQWSDGDRINKPIEEIKKELCEIYPEDCLLIGKILDDCTDMFQTVNSPEDTLAQLKKHGFALYYLSNIGEQVLSTLQKKHIAFSLFDGGVASYIYQIVKPDPKIYNILLEKYNLLACECLFIDDMLANVEAAKKLGFQTIHLKNAEDLRDELKRIDGVGIALI